MAAFAFVIGPAKIAQIVYDTTQRISNHPLGWLLIGITMGSCSSYVYGDAKHHIPSVVVCFPPMIGHTTMLNLCGFAYGIRGFVLAASASLIGSAIAFLTLRLLFSQYLRKWSSTNRVWKALGDVIVGASLFNVGYLNNIPSERQRTTTDHPHSAVVVSALGIFQCAVCSMFNPSLSPMREILIPLRSLSSLFQPFSLW